jgi:hypothetical protein
MNVLRAIAIHALMGLLLLCILFVVQQLYGSDTQFITNVFDYILSCGFGLFIGVAAAASLVVIDRSKFTGYVK